MQTNGQQDRDNELTSCDEYQLDAFARGWDTQARKQGNKRATVKSPAPFTIDAYYEGFHYAKKWGKRR